MLTKGTAGPNCLAEDDVSVTVHSETLSFTNSAVQNFVVGFHPRTDGSFHQTYMGDGGATVDIHCRLVGNVIEADVSNPPCEYHWHPEKTN